MGGKDGGIPSVCGVASFSDSNVDDCMRTLLRLSRHWFDRLDNLREGPGARRVLATGLIIAFVAGLVVIELNRQGWLPAPLAGRLPTNHFHAFDVAFTLLLIVEIVELVFGLATSVAGSVGKQFEIFSLILLRDSFKELVYFQEPIQWTFGDENAREAVQLILTDAVGALLIFVTIGGYYKLQRHQPITESQEQQHRFVDAKKLVANLLLATLAVLGAYTVVALVRGGGPIAFFDTVYTVLIFVDVLIVLVSLRYSASYHVVFRNFGFAAATVMLRLALAGPPYVDAALGLGAALFCVGLTAAYNFVSPAVQQSRHASQRRRVLTGEAVATDDE